MEFFSHVSRPDLDVKKLKELLPIRELNSVCASIDTVLSENGNDGKIYCIWGEFDVRRQELKHGVRFSLLNCPHALAWSVTVDEADGKVVIHCTIDKQEEDQDFVDSIEAFVRDWSAGLTASP